MTFSSCLFFVSILLSISLDCDLAEDPECNYGNAGTALGLCYGSSETEGYRFVCSDSEDNTLNQLKYDTSDCDDEPVLFYSYDCSSNATDCECDFADDCNNYFYFNQYPQGNGTCEGDAWIVQYGMVTDLCQSSDLVFGFGGGSPVKYTCFGDEIVITSYSDDECITQTGEITHDDSFFDGLGLPACYDINCVTDGVIGDDDDDDDDNDASSSTSMPSDDDDDDDDDTTDAGEMINVSMINISLFMSVLYLMLH